MIIVLAPHRQALTPYPTVSMSDILNRPRTSWLIRGMLPSKAVAMIAGAPSSGKSLAAIDAAIAVVHGTDYLGHKVVNPGGVLYICAEGADGLRDRFEAHTKAFGTKQSPLLRVIEHAVQLHDFEAGERLLATVGAEEERWQAFCPRAADGEMQPTYKTRLIIVDTLGQSSVEVEENSNTAMNKLFQSIRSIQQRTGAAVLLVHHFGKNGSVRGASAITGALDVEILFERKKDAAGWSPMIEVKNSKMKDGAREFAPLHLLMETIELGIDPDTNEPITGAVLKRIEPHEAAERADARDTCPGREVQPAQ